MFQLSFVVPGFSKCGTCTLCDLLGQHPDLFIPDCKETGFFDINYHLGAEWYEELYAAAKPGQLCFDGSTNYSVAQHAEAACSRLLAHSPQAKFIFIARSPLTRLESLFREIHHNGHHFGVAGEYDIGRTLKKFPNMMDDTRYWDLINIYRRAVGDSRIHVVFLEEFEANPKEQTKRCFEFLGVDSSFQLKDHGKRLNAGSTKQYDSRLMRFIRHRPWASNLWNRLSQRRRDKLTKTLRLRRPFVGPVHWRPEAIAWVQKQLIDDTRAFLKHYDRPESFWSWTPRTALPRSKAA